MATTVESLNKGEGPRAELDLSLDYGSLPLIVRPRTLTSRDPERLAALLHTHPAWLRRQLHAHGALVFSGFDIHQTAQFERLAELITGELKPYTGGDSPRLSVHGHVYTSTEYAPHYEIRLHNELSYGAWWPRFVCFYCEHASGFGGETQIADGRQVYAHMPHGIRDRFERLGVRYTQHLPSQQYAGGAKSWQQTFGTEGKAVVDAHCRAGGMEWEWTATGLRTAIKRPGVLRHEQTGQMAWFNQADLWHERLQTTKLSTGRGVTAAAHAHASYGDGSEIDTGDLLQVRAICKAVEVARPWQAGELLVLDNVLTLHGRKPYAGSRRVLVAMG